MAWQKIDCTAELHMNESLGGTLLRGDITSLDLSRYYGQVQCVYIDPPFYTGDEFEFRMRYGREGWEKGTQVLTLPAYSDAKDGKDAYLSLIRVMLTKAHDLLSDTGALFLHLDSRMNAYARLLCDEIFGENNFINEIIWAYQSGGRSRRHFSRKHDVILFYAKTKNLFFDITRVPIPRTQNRDNHMRRTVGEDGRSCRTIRVGGKLYTYYDDDPVYPDDVWTDVSHLQQKDPQRTGYDTQKPRALLDRIIRCSTKPGDLVADLCCGSGTTLISAHENGCRYLGVDIGRNAVSICRKRLLDTALTLIAPIDDTPVLLDAEVLPGIGYHAVTLRDYRLCEADRERLSALTNGRPPEGLDLIDQWSVGFMRDGVFNVHTSAARKKQTPDIAVQLDLPVLRGDPVLETVDILGNRTLWTYSL